jgi:integrase
MTDRYIQDVLPQSRTMHLNWWKSEIGKYALADVTPSMIAELRDRLLKEPTPRGKKRSPSTVVRYMPSLSHTYTIAVKEWGWIDDSPMRKVIKPKEPRGRVRFLSDEERERLLEARKESKNLYIYTIVVLALSTGMRYGEIVHLKWNDIDFEHSRVILHETKNNERRGVHISGHALECLKGLSKIRRIDTNLVFPSTKHFPDGKGKPIEFRKPWLTALAKAEIGDFRFHDLRHSCASYLAMNGASLAEIAEVLGHKSLQMVKRYSHISETHTSKVVARMNEKIFGTIN